MFFYIVASRFYKIREKLLPSNPKSLDFQAPQLYSTTNDGEEFLIYDSISKRLGGRLMIFSTQSLIQMLCECEIILIDGTFKTRPTLFSQVYVIMGQHLDEGPCIFFLIDHIFFISSFSYSIGLVSYTKTHSRNLRKNLQGVKEEGTKIWLHV